MARNKLVDLIQERENINKEIRELREKEKNNIGNYVISLFGDIDMSLDDFKEEDLNTFIKSFLENLEEYGNLEIFYYYFEQKGKVFESDKEFLDFILKDYLGNLLKNLQNDEDFMRSYRQAKSSN